MKRKITIVIALVIISYSLSWALDKPLIDPEYKKIDEAIKKTTEECMSKQKNPLKKLECGRDLKNKFEQEGKIRGTDEYCEANYTELNLQGLEKLLKELRQQQKNARSSLNLMWDDEKLGEVTKEDLQTEMIWVESRLAKMQKANVQKMEKSIKYKKSWGKE